MRELSIGVVEPRDLRIAKPDGAFRLDRARIQIGLDARDVCLWRIHPSIEPIDDLEPDFQAAVDSAAQVEHRVLPRLLGTGRLEDRTFAAFEWIDGTDLWSLLKNRGLPLSPSASLMIAGLLAEALEWAAHFGAKPTVHGGICPSRVMISKSGEVKLLGFGFGALRERLLERMPTFRGEAKPRFVPPERQSGELTIASDVYAIGRLLVWLSSEPSSNASDADSTAESLPDHSPNEITAVSRAALQLDPRDRPSFAELHSLCRAAQAKLEDGSGGWSLADLARAGSTAPRAGLAAAFDLDIALPTDLGEAAPKNATRHKTRLAAFVPDPADEPLVTEPGDRTRSSPGRIWPEPSLPSQVGGPETLIGHSCHGYRLEKLLGEGSFSYVFAAKHEFLAEMVAVKVLKRQIAASSVMRRRMFREAEALGRLRHPNLVRVYDCGVGDADVPFVVMELLEGVTLAKVLELPLATARMLRIIRQVAAGLVAVHGQGLVHRDVKPRNIIVSGEDETVKLLDFGTVRLVDDVEATRLTAAHGLFGTPRYMAPEQVLNPSEVGPAADLYAVGTILYEMLSGKAPWEGNVDSVVRHRLEDQPPPLPLSAGSLGTLAMDLLKTDPRARVGALALIERLDLIAGEIERTAEVSALASLSATHAPITKTLRNAAKRGPALMFGILCACSLALAFVAGRLFEERWTPKHTANREMVGPFDPADPGGARPDSPGIRAVAKRELAEPPPPIEDRSSESTSHGRVDDGSNRFEATRPANRVASNPRAGRSRPVETPADVEIAPSQPDLTPTVINRVVIERTLDRVVELLQRPNSTPNDQVQALEDSYFRLRRQLRDSEPREFVDLLNRAEALERQVLAIQ